MNSLGYWDKEKQQARSFVLLSNGIKDKVEALDIYRGKDVVEKAFNNLKKRLNMKRTSVSSDENLEGKLFIQFVALIYLSYIKKQSEGWRSDKETGRTLELNSLTFQHDPSMFQPAETSISHFKTVFTTKIFNDLKRRHGVYLSMNCSLYIGIGDCPSKASFAKISIYKQKFIQIIAWAKQQIIEYISTFLYHQDLYYQVY